MLRRATSTRGFLRDVIHVRSETEKNSMTNDAASRMQMCWNQTH